MTTTASKGPKVPYRCSFCEIPVFYDGAPSGVRLTEPELEGEDEDGIEGPDLPSADQDEDDRDEREGAEKEAGSHGCLRRDEGSRARRGAPRDVGEGLPQPVGRIAVPTLSLEGSSITAGPATGLTHAHHRSRRR